MSHFRTPAGLRSRLDDVRAGHVDAVAFARSLRADAGLIGALTPRHAEVLDQLLMRLESGSLVSEESCSFSRHELVDGLAAWLEHACRHLERTTVTT